MKALILISSIFYILGFKISNKFDLIKKVHPVEKIITTPVPAQQPSNAIHYNDETKSATSADSLKSVKKTEYDIENSKHF